MMDIELGIQNVARPVNFSSDESAEKIGSLIADAVANQTMIDITDSKGRRILVPGRALGYATIGSETRHAVGFGAL
jgi:F420-0:gamma-glutamyl ligase